MALYYIVDTSIQNDLNTDFFKEEGIKPRSLFPENDIKYPIRLKNTNEDQELIVCDSCLHIIVKKKDKKHALDDLITKHITVENLVWRKMKVYAALYGTVNEALKALMKTHDLDKQFTMVITSTKVKSAKIIEKENEWIPPIQQKDKNEEDGVNKVV